MSNAIPMPTASGRLIDPWTMAPSDIDPDDLAGHLAKICRYNGATREFYSVAQHSILVYRLSGDDPWGLLHDAPEAYTGDIVAPLEPEGIGWFARSLHHPPLVDRTFRELREHIESAVAARFGLELPIPRHVHEADMIARTIECRDLLAAPVDIDSPPPGFSEIRPEPPGRAEEQFRTHLRLVFPHRAA